MKRATLRSKILLFFALVIAFLSVLSAVLGYYLVKKYIIGEAQKKVNLDIKMVGAEYRSQLDRTAIAFAIATPQTDLAVLKKAVDLDYLYIVTPEEAARAKSEIVRQSLEKHGAFGGNRLIEPQELKAMGEPLYQHALIKLQKTEKAYPPRRVILDTALSIEYSRPFFDPQGRLVSLLYGGRIIHKDPDVIDKIVNVAFENKFYDRKPVATVTIFLDDVRIVTNVLDDKGQRAVGTLVSQKVYDEVVKKGKSWHSRAFVVTDWCLTTYEPVRDINGKVIGIIYVGILEKPFKDLVLQLFMVFLGIIVCAGALAFFLSYFLTSRMSTSMEKMLDAISRMSDGHFTQPFSTSVSIEEFDRLIAAFNVMAKKVREREESLKQSMGQYAALNKRYLDLVGFVSHELNGLLSSIVLNAYLLEHKILGEVNEQQVRTLRTMSRNLGYLANTVKNFLGLSRIEKGELHLDTTEFSLAEHVFSVSEEALAEQAQERAIKIINELDPQARVRADVSLMQIVANNLLSNAIKYGAEGGKIVMSSSKVGDMLEVEVYNDGHPLASADLEKLFKKFSRVIQPGTEKVKGSGIGLFITKEIIEKHGGKIWAEPRLQGNAFIFQIPRIL